MKTVKLFFTLLMKHPLSFADKYYKWNQMSKNKKKVNNSLNLYEQLYLDSV